MLSEIAKSLEDGLAAIFTFLYSVTRGIYFVRCLAGPQISLVLRNAKRREEI